MWLANKVPSLAFHLSHRFILFYNQGIPRTRPLLLDSRPGPLLWSVFTASFMSTRQKADRQPERPNRQNRQRRQRQERPPQRDRPRHRHGNNNNNTRLPEQACRRSLLQAGMAVLVVQKHDQSTGRETAGTIARILTNSDHHPRGIKVMLESGIVGRVTRRRGENENDGRPTTTTTIMSHGSRSPGGTGRAFYSTTATTATTATATAATTLATLATRSSASTGSSLNDNNVDDMALARLVGEMDFDEIKARQALVAAGNNLERAIDMMLSQSTE